MIRFDETMLQGMEETCRDFDIFCDFLLSGSVKLSKKTGSIGRKDCFTLNKMMMVQEDFEKPGRDQNRYDIINYFYYAAFRYRILEMNEKGDAAQEGIHYGLFRDASVMERYLLLVACFLLDRRIFQDEMGMGWTLNEIAEWAASIKGEKSDLYELPPTIRPVYEGKNLRTVFKYLDELRIARIADVSMPEGEGRAAWRKSVWRIETGKLFPFLCDLGKYISRYPDREEVEELVQFICGDYIKKIFKDQFTGNILKMFEEADGDEFPAEDTELGMLELRKGQRFSYLFDFGDMWWFDIRVLGIKEGKVPEPELTKAVGKAPEQYPMW